MKKALAAALLLLPVSVARAGNGLLEVRVTGPDGKAPATVRVEFGHHSLEMSTTAAGGVAHLAVSTKEPGYVRAAAALDRRGVALPWAPTRVDVEAAATRVEIRMKKGLEVSGRTLDEAGKAVGGVTVVARDAGEIHHDPLAQARSGADGKFRLVGLGETEVDLTTERLDAYAGAAPIRVAGGAKDLRIVLRRAQPHVVRVVDSDGKPLAHAQFTVMQLSGPPSSRSGRSVVYEKTGSDGSVRIPALDPTLSLSLKVEPDDAREDLAPLEIDPWVPKSGDVVVPRGFVATMRVTDDEDRPVAAKVHLLIPARNPGFDMGGFAPQSDPDASGRVRVPRLPYGPSKFQAIPEKPAKVFPPTSPWVSVDEHHREATLRIPTRGERMTVRSDPPSSGLVGVVFADLGGSTMPFHDLEFDDEGVASIESVAPGRYVAYVFRERGAEGTVGRLEVPEFSKGEIRVPLVEPATLRIRAKAPASATDLVGLILVQGMAIGKVRVVEEGVLGSSGLPPGRYPVSVFARDGERRLEGAVFADTGTEASVELKPAD